MIDNIPSLVEKHEEWRGKTLTLQLSLGDFAV